MWKHSLVLVGLSWLVAGDGVHLHENGFIAVTNRSSTEAAVEAAADPRQLTVFFPSWGQYRKYVSIALPFFKCARLLL
jgi:hypothetical protein